MTVAETLAPAIEGLLGRDLPVALRFWDGSAMGQDSSTWIEVRSHDAVRRLMYAPNELGLGRAYVAGDIDIHGDIFEVLSLRDRLGDPTRHVELKLRPGVWLGLARSARTVGALGRPLPAPPEEARLHGRLHSRARDAAAVQHHYDVSNDFYALFLGSTMTYSCAYFVTPDASLDDAQTAKYELICRKLGLTEGMRLLDVGCGWGGMLIHAASRHGVGGVGVTLSRKQADLGAKRVAAEGLADRIEIRLQDYRDLSGERFDAISSIGMFEHVGLGQLERYFASMYDLLEPRGRLLNHGISKPPGETGLDKHSFVARYVFPDGALHEVGAVVSAMQGRGFEVRDVESLREHYARTLRHWVANLESNWDEAVEHAGTARARVWRLYMAGAAINFEAGRTSVHQVLGIKTGSHGDSGMPATRPSFIA
jgi:cyclopropane-fatty-acyl-phospholipid synthase